MQEQKYCISMDAKQKPSILMLPWLAHGHVSPFLELAKKLSRKNFHIYFCSTPIILQSIKENLIIDEEFIPSIQLLELHLPSSPELPPHYHTTNGLPLHLVPSLITAFDQSKSSFSAIIRTWKPDLILYDAFQPWAATAAREENIKGSVFFLTSSAAISLGLYSFSKETEEKYGPEASKYLQGSINGVVSAERHRRCFDWSSEILLQKTSRDIEAKNLHDLSVSANKKVLTTGPLVPDSVKHGSQEDKKIMNWMDEKDPGSVVFVSFGTEYYLSKEDIVEMACGLELSQACFIWVLRFDRDENNRCTNIHEALPSGFLERVTDSKTGIVIEGWAPQVKILGHRNIGGFVSHCGWSSVNEAIVWGVPIIAMPMMSDQPRNAKLAVEMGVAMEVERDDGKTIKRENVARAIREVIGREGQALRGRARELSDRVRVKGEEEFDEAVEELRRLCTQ